MHFFSREFDAQRQVNAEEHPVLLTEVPRGRNLWFCYKAGIKIRIINSFLTSSGKAKNGIIPDQFFAIYQI